MTRAPVPRPRKIHVYSYACPRCDILLCDGVAYVTCPSCDAKVDWVDLRQPIYACPTCDALVNAERKEVPECATCKRKLKQIHVSERPPLPRRMRTGTPFTRRMDQFFEAPLGASLLLFASMAPALSLAVDPQWRWLGIAQFLPLVLAPVLIAGIFLAELGDLYRQLRDVAKDKTTRVIHGIEHATVVELQKRGVLVQGGLTESGYFKVWVDGDIGAGKQRLEDAGVKKVREACVHAIGRLRSERWSLAINRRCGTAWLTLFMLGAVLVLGAAGLGLFFTIAPATLVWWAGGALAVLLGGARPLGWLMQRLFTIDVDFQKAEVQRVTRAVEGKGVSCYYVYLAVELPH